MGTRVIDLSKLDEAERAAWLAWAVERTQHGFELRDASGDYVELINKTAPQVAIKKEYYMLFAGADYEARGGFRDYIDTFDNAQAAMDYFTPKNLYATDWGQVARVVNGKPEILYEYTLLGREKERRWYRVDGDNYLPLDASAEVVECPSK